ncbi:MAG: GNAT family N-acetyltransferase [Xenococcaceae cyanobacterium]
MLEIKPIESRQIEEVKELILTVNQEVLKVDRSTILSVEEDFFEDLDNIQEHYLNNRGVFLVLLDKQKVVGSGAIRYLENDICELKRMYLLKSYRGQNWGKKIGDDLLDFAKNKNYKRVRLDLANAEKQKPAMNFYKNLGFYSIPRYNSSPCQVFMEKIL